MNNTAIITGASSGMGEATARLLASKGYQLLLGARRIEKLEALAKSLQTQYGVDVIAQQLDITNDKDLEAFEKTASKNFDKVDVLINNAGVADGGSPDVLSTDNIENVINVNVLGTIKLTRLFLPKMKTAKNGHIVNISSTAGHYPAGGFSVYAASKFAINGFTSSLRQELSPYNIRVTDIISGPTDTELISHHSNDEVRANVTDWFNSLETLKVKDIANGIYYAISQPQHVNVSDIVIRPVQASGIL